jgi:hypothetical protein
MSKQATEAIRAAKNVKSWGKFSTYLYAKKRGILPLYRLACQLEVVKEF